MEIQIRVLSIDGCQSTPPTIKLIQAVVNELDIACEVSSLVVSSQDEANQVKLLGSPIVQINGLDIEPSARDSQLFSLA